MVDPELLPDPETLVGASVQLKVVPATLELNAILVFCPLQIFSGEGVAVTSGLGFIVTVAVVVPVQPDVVPLMV
jgi:hypothetical protein